MPHAPKVSQQLLSRLADVSDLDSVTRLSVSSQNQTVNNLLYTLQQNFKNRRHLFTTDLQSKSPYSPENCSVVTLKKLSYNREWNTSANHPVGQPSAELSESASPFLSDNQLGQRNWLLGLAERTKRYIYRVESTTFNNLTPEIIGRQGETFAISLAQQLSVPLPGQTIALDLLMDSVKILRQVEPGLRERSQSLAGRTPVERTGVFPTQATGVPKVQRDKEQVISNLSSPDNSGSNSGDRQTTVSKSTIVSRALDKLSLPQKARNKQSQIVAATPRESASVIIFNNKVTKDTNIQRGLSILPPLHSQMLLSNSLGELETSSVLPTPSLVPQNDTRHRITPTVEVTPLPPLLPLPMVNLAPTSVASVIIREEAKQEISATSDDDLNILAAKIKRILDEEARRYGIDV